MRFIVLCLLALALYACVSSKELGDSFLNKGVVPLSYDNPYLGANLFLSQEAQKSSVLMNFLRKRGAPHAIELKDSFRTPAKLTMYYLGTSAEAYRADLQQSEHRYEWVVNGPFVLSRSQFVEVRNMLDGGARDPVLLLGQRETRLGPTPTPTPTPTATKVPTRKPVVKKKKVEPVVTEPKTSATEIALPTPTSSAFNFTFPLNSDQQALLRARGFAERTASGDLVHTVKASSETVEVIVQWYTGSKNNMEAVLKFNALPEKAELQTGQKLVIPKDLVIQPKELR